MMFVAVNFYYQFLKPLFMMYIALKNVLHTIAEEKNGIFCKHKVSERIINTSLHRQLLLFSQECDASSLLSYCYVGHDCREWHFRLFACVSLAFLFVNVFMINENPTSRELSFADWDHARLSKCLRVEHFPVWIYQSKVCRMSVKFVTNYCLTCKHSCCRKFFSFRDFLSLCLPTKENKVTLVLVLWGGVFL